MTGIFTHDKQLPSKDRGSQRVQPQPIDTSSSGESGGQGRRKQKKKMDNAMETGRGCPPPWLHRPAVKTSPVLIREGKDEDFSLGAQEKKPTLQLQQKKNHTKKGEIAWLCYNGDQCSTARSTDLDLDNTSSPILDTLIKYRME